MAPLLIVELRLRSESESWGKRGTVCDLWKRSWNLRSRNTEGTKLPTVGEDWPGPRWDIRSCICVNRASSPVWLDLKGWPTGLEYLRFFCRSAIELSPVSLGVVQDPRLLSLATEDHG